MKEFGEGVDRMCSELLEAGVPEPKYRVVSFMLRCTVKAAGAISSKPSDGRKTVEVTEEIDLPEQYKYLYNSELDKLVHLLEGEIKQETGQAAGQAALSLVHD